MPECCSINSHSCHCSIGFEFQYVLHKGNCPKTEIYMTAILSFALTHQAFLPRHLTSVIVKTQIIFAFLSRICSIFMRILQYISFLNDWGNSTSVISGLGVQAWGRGIRYLGFGVKGRRHCIVANCARSLRL